jgi:uncharacterized protein
LIQRCQRCQTYVHPPGPVCPICFDGELAYEPVTGRGSIWSFTRNNQRWDTTSQTDEYVIAIIELDEQPGLRLVSNIVNAPREQVQIGGRVRATFVKTDEVHIPVFEPL